MRTGPLAGSTRIELRRGPKTVAAKAGYVDLHSIVGSPPTASPTCTGRRTSLPLSHLAYLLLEVMQPIEDAG